MLSTIKREEGFYNVVVMEHGGSFETIGLWVDYGGYGGWKFAEGDGNEQGSRFAIIGVDERMIMKDRVYVNGSLK